MLSKVDVADFAEINRALYGEVRSLEAQVDLLRGLIGCLEQRRHALDWRAAVVYPRPAGKPTEAAASDASGEDAAEEDAAFSRDHAC